ncbi:MAG: hypothetical protein KDC39_04025 [Actinobacteria bacterium]|nr:hypothetical protein [Actinomycetota bacterium]
MGVTEDARTKAQANVSEAEAEVKKLEAQLATAKAKAKVTDAGGSVIEALTKAPIIKENTDFIRQHTEANSAEAKAEVDRIEADLVKAQSRLKWANRMLNAVESVNDKMNEFLEYDGDVDYDNDDLPDRIGSSQPESPNPSDS